MSMGNNNSTGNTPSKRAEYEKRLARVRDYLRAHLDEEIDLNRLAEIAHMSPYHWHRIYRSITGETITATVRRLRMTRAADLVSRTTLPMEDIAKKTGYPNAQSFSRVFKSTFGMPPGQYRERGTHTRFKTTSLKEIVSMHPVSVQTIDPRRVVYLDHTGPYTEISHAFGALYGTLAAKSMMTPQMQMCGVYYDDPDVVAEDELRSRACLTVTSDLDIEAPIEHMDIAGGRYAVLKYTGPYTDMHAAYRWLFGTWLVDSGLEVANEPAYEVYLNDPQTTPPARLRTDIHVPLA